MNVPGTQPTVRIVEDEDSFVDALVGGLKREGFLVHAARDGIAALEMFDLVRPDLVLLDANPILDVANLDKISGVFLRGKYYSRAVLDKILSDVAAAYAAQPLRELSPALDPTHID